MKKLFGVLLLGVSVEVVLSSEQLPLGNHSALQAPTASQGYIAPEAYTAPKEHVAPQTNNASRTHISPKADIALKADIVTQADILPQEDNLTQADIAPEERIVPQADIVAQGGNVTQPDIVAQGVNVTQPDIVAQGVNVTKADVVAQGGNVTQPDIVAQGVNVTQADIVAQGDNVTQAGIVPQADIVAQRDNVTLADIAPQSNTVPHEDNVNQTDTEGDDEVDIVPRANSVPQADIVDQEDNVTQATIKPEMHNVSHTYITTRSHISSKAHTPNFSRFQVCFDDKKCPSDRGCRGQCIDPCTVSRCGVNAICIPSNHQVNCFCKSGFYGEPLQGCISQSQIACSNHQQCPKNQECYNSRCTDICSIHCSGYNTDCRVLDRKAVCTCKRGFQGDPTIGCFPGGYNEGWPPGSGEKRYILYTVKKDVLGAYAFCLDNEGRLAIVNSEKENQMILKAAETTNSKGKQFWTSGTDLAQEGRWIWLPTGKKFNPGFSYWLKDQPSNSGNNEHCLEYWYDKKIGYRWNDRPCHEKHYFVCEYYS